MTDHIGYSADYHGSALSNLLGLVPGQDTTAPSILQQKYDADFIAALRSRGGDSAYVPTTNLYSAYVDEVVEPQFGPFASGALSDARRVGVTNNEVQEICPGQPSLFVYSHEGVLYNPVAWALARDALSHDGPGQVSRLGDLGSLCASYLAQGLGNENILLTEDVVVFSVMNLLRYPNKVTKEPPIKSESFLVTLLQMRWTLTLGRLCFVASFRLRFPYQSATRLETCQLLVHVT